MKQQKVNFPVVNVVRNISSPNQKSFVQFTVAFTVSVHYGSFDPKGQCEGAQQRSLTVYSKRKINSKVKGVPIHPENYSDEGWSLVKQSLLIKAPF